MDLAAFLTLVDKGVGLANLTDVMPEQMPEVPADPRERFFGWVDDESPFSRSVSNLALTLHHLETFWEQRERPNVVLLHYGELEADLPGEMSRLAQRIGIDITDAEIAELAPHASFEVMRGRASEVAPNATEPIWLDTVKFFHTGASGQWRDLLDESDLKRYEARVMELASPEFSDWVHQGPIVA
jgi:aryl sulfotransferase